MITEIIGWIAFAIGAVLILSQRKWTSWISVTGYIITFTSGWILMSYYLPNGFSK